jgi:tetratricopeptide (TPR) repeat protein
MGKARKKRAATRDKESVSPYSLGTNFRHWAPIVVGLASLAVAVFGVTIVLRSSTESRHVSAASRRLEAEQAVFQAWDLLGGRPGSLNLQGLKKDKETLELARRQIERALSLDPGNIPALLCKAAHLRASGEPERSLELMRHVARFAPQEPVVYSYLGLALSDQGKHEEAIEYFRQAITLGGQSASEYYNLGTALWRTGNLTEADKLLRRSIELDSMWAPPLTNLSAVLMEQEEFIEAAEVARAAARASGNDAVSLNNLGTILGNGGDEEEALQIFTQAIEREPEFAISYFNRGTTRRDLGDWEAAAADLRRAIELDQRLVPAYINLVGIFRDQGKEAEAQEVLDAARKVGIVLDLPKTGAEEGRRSQAVERTGTASKAPGPAAHRQPRYCDTMSLLYMELFPS